MIAQTLGQLRQLKLNCMATALQTQLEQPGTYDGLAFSECLHLLVDHEDHDRNQSKQERLTRTTHFKLKAHAKDIDYQHTSGLQQSQMAALLMCDWLKKSSKPVADMALWHRQNLYCLRARTSSLSERLQRQILPASQAHSRIDTSQGGRQL